MFRLRRRSLIIAAFVSALVAPGLAHAAPGSDACVAASERAQELRNAGKLASARDELLICSKAECPKIVQQDCTQWMGEVLAAMPSVVPAARGPNGKDLVEGRLLVDGKVATETLDGKPVPVDTGAHVLRLESPGMKPAEERVVIRTGEQNRVVSWTLEAAPLQATPPTAPLHRETKPSIVPYLLAGAGVLFLGGALYMDLSATGDAHDLRSSCAPNCRQDDVDDIKQKYLIAGIGTGVGAAALVAGAVYYFVTRKNSDTGMAVSPLRVGRELAQGRISF